MAADSLDPPAAVDPPEAEGPRSESGRRKGRAERLRDARAWVLENHAETFRKLAEYDAKRP